MQAVAPLNSTPVANNQARTLLQLADGNANNWTAFQTDQYLRTYPAVRDDLADTDPARVLRFYLDRGQALGHSPNSFFDEAFFLAQTPVAAAAVQAGEAASGFDLYCRDAGRHRWPHCSWQ